MWTRHNKRRACVNGVREVALDVMYLLMLVLVLVTVRGTLKVLTDMVSFLPRYPRFVVARAIISYHFSLAANAMFVFAAMFFSCRAVKFALATATFAVFSPGVMLEGWIKRINRAHGDSGSKCLAAPLLVIASVWMFGVPFLAANQGTPEYTAKPAAIYFGVMLAFVALAVVIAVAQDDDETKQLRRPVVRFARPTVQNFLAYGYLLVEAAQLVALSFSAAAAAGMLDDWRVREYSQFVFLLFGQGWTDDGLAFGAYFAVAVMALHFFVVAMPIVTTHILDWDGDEISGSPVWVSAVSLISFLMQLMVARNVAELLSCQGGRSTYNLQWGWVGPPPLMNTTNTTAPYVPTCWQGPHRGLAIAAMILGVFYIPTTLSRNSYFDESADTSVDVVYTQLYRMLTGLATVLAAVMVALLPGNGRAALIVVLTSSLWCLLVSLCYTQIAGGGGASGLEVPFVTLPALKWGRIGVYTGSTLAAVFCLIQVDHGADRASLWAFWASIGVTAGLYVAALVGSAIARRLRHPEDDSIDAARQTLLRLEAALVSSEKVVLTWPRARDAWIGTVQSATRVSVLALATAKLQDGISIFRQSSRFLRQKPSWNAELGSLISGVDIEDDVESVLRTIGGRDRRYCFGDFEADCDCCCDGSGRRSSRSGARARSEDDAAASMARQQQQVDVLSRAVQSLVNATSDDAAPDPEPDQELPAAAGRRTGRDDVVAAAAARVTAARAQRLQDRRARDTEAPLVLATNEDLDRDSAASGDHYAPPTGPGDGFNDRDMQAAIAASLAVPQAGDDDTLSRETSL